MYVEQKAPSIEVESSNQILSKKSSISQLPNIKPIEISHSAVWRVAKVIKAIALTTLAVLLVPLAFKGYRNAVRDLWKECFSGPVQIPLHKLFNRKTNEIVSPEGRQKAAIEALKNPNISEGNKKLYEAMELHPNNFSPRLTNAKIGGVKLIQFKENNLDDTLDYKINANKIKDLIKYENKAIGKSIDQMALDRILYSTSEVFTDEIFTQLNANKLLPDDEWEVKNRKDQKRSYEIDFQDDKSPPEVLVVSNRMERIYRKKSAAENDKTTQTVCVESQVMHDLKSGKVTFKYIYEVNGKREEWNPCEKKGPTDAEEEKTASPAKIFKTAADYISYINTAEEAVDWGLNAVGAIDAKNPITNLASTSVIKGTKLVQSVAQYGGLIEGISDLQALKAEYKRIQNRIIEINDPESPETQTLKNQLEELDVALLNYQQETTKSAFSTTANISGAVAAIGKAAVAKGSDVAKAFAIHASATGLVGNVIGIASSAIALSNDLQTINRHEVLFEHLNQLLLKLPKDSLERKVVAMKLKQLEKQSDSLFLSSSQNNAAIVSSTLGLASTIGGIVTASGVTIGVAGATIISASGIGAGIIAGVSFVAGASYFVHKHQYAISNIMESAPVTAELWMQEKHLNKLKQEKAEKKVKYLTGKFFVEDSLLFLGKIESAKKSQKSLKDKQIDELKQIKDSINKDEWAIVKHAKKRHVNSKIKNVEKNSNKRLQTLDEIQRERLLKLASHVEDLENLKNQPLAEDKLKNKISLKEKKIKALSEKQKDLADKSTAISIAAEMFKVKYKEINEFTKELEIGVKDPAILKNLEMLFPMLGGTKLDEFHKDPVNALLEVMKTGVK